ncbi:pseudaminic acid cytidylyltransferase [Erythrobacter ani]|uniref:Pseudaminic acid cytidylyltransferase n=1 Tax=Erythrobacter ani TaxID=2827235 RepID=A0ABS6SIH7_9SPHN|nr:pseudaminic acid cytidylyltransferase [Erythrobacter ani]MBV7264815.1 pseudaminic acid cytidylyltransferase [Erythrobacter ani]
MNIAIIPARGGSKRIPRKNIRPFAGKPMIAWPIETATNSGLFDRIIVSTDDDEIAEIARAAGAETPFIRPAELADDHSGTTDVVVHALSALLDTGPAIDAACCIYATAAFISADDLRLAYSLLSSECDFAFPAVRYGHPPQRGFVTAADGSPQLLQPGHQATRTQDLPPVFHDPGQFYWGKSEAWLECRSFFGSRTRFIEIPETRAWDIDRPEDWTIAESLFSAMREQER